MTRRLLPSARYSQDAYEAVLGEQVGPTTRWLDLGCGHQVLSQWREQAERALVGRAKHVVGVDYDLPSLRTHRSIRHRVRGGASELPFAPGSFDLVTANMVVEHLDDPVRQFREITRVLAPGGRVVFHTPNAVGYTTVLARMVPEVAKKRVVRFLDGRVPEDVFPTFYRANTEGDIRRVAEAAGLRVRALHMVASLPALTTLPPLLLFELLWLRATSADALRRWRTNIIAVLERTATSHRDRHAAPQGDVSA